MHFVRTASRFFVCAALTAAIASATPQPAPRLVSPGNERQDGRVGSECPTFSWAPAHGPTGYKLVVYGISGVADTAADTSSKPLLEIELPDGALSWTPSLGECLPGAGHYSWAVGARGEDGEIHWSTPGIFRVIAREAPRAPEPRQPATTTRLDGVSVPIVQSPPPVGAVISLTDSPLPRSLSDEAFSPPACNGSVFSDITGGHPLCDWIEKFSFDQIVTTCGGGKYCPDNPVTRAQFALFAQRIMRGTDTWRREAGDGAAPNLPPGPPTVTPLDSASAVGEDTSVTIGADGLGLISYRDDTNDDLKVAHCSNVDCTAATITPLDTTGDVGWYTSITIGADGLGLISYYDVANQNLKVAHCADVNCTGTTVPPTSLDTAGNVGEYTSLTVGADGLGLISYYDNTADDLKVAHCSNVNCTAATITSLDTGGNVGFTTSIAIGADGLGLISYLDFTNADLKVAHCSNVNCTAATITSLDTAGAVGLNSSTAIGADGLGLISYYDATNDDLRVAHCSNVNCTGTTVPPTTLDDPAVEIVDVGVYTSISIGADGLGLISYHDVTNGDLKVAHCSNVDCTAATITPLDTTGLVGWYTSVTIGADGLGLITYWGITNGDLKVVHCSNVLCAPYFRRR